MPLARRGNSMVQLVIALPVVCMIGFGLVEYGQFFATKNAMLAAARTGARAAVDSAATNSTVQAAVNSSLASSNMASVPVTITLSPPDVAGLPTGMQIQVTLTTTWGQADVGVLSSSWGGISPNKQILARVTMNRE